MPTPVMPRTKPEVSYDVFMGVLWSFVAVSFCFVAFRLIIRWRTFKRLAWDDGAVILAWIMYLTSACLYKTQMPRLYKQYDALQGKVPFDAEMVELYSYFMRMIVPFNVLFYSSLWAVKISFMLFFAKLGNKLQNFKLWWWTVLIITLIAYVGCIADIQYDCTIPRRDFAYISLHCNTLESIHWVLKTLYANAGLDIGTDILILSIPTLILWNTGVPTKKKIILLSVFSATVVIMIVALIRVLLVNSGDMSPEIAWLYFWSSVEVGVAIIIACVASFRQLFVATRDQGSSNNSGNSKSPFRFLGSSFGKSTKGSSKGTDATSGKWNASRGKAESVDSDTERGQSHDRILQPLEFVTVHADGHSKESYRRIDESGH